MSRELTYEENYILVPDQFHVQFDTQQGYDGTESVLFYYTYVYKEGFRGDNV